MQTFYMVVSTEDGGVEVDRIEAETLGDASAGSEVVDNIITILNEREAKDLFDQMGKRLFGEE